MPDLQCHACGARVTIGEPIPRDAECDACRHDLRCCTNCRHYDTRYNNSCRETSAEPVEDKERRNFCEYFSFSREPHGRSSAVSAKQDDARRKLDSLFGGQRSATDRKDDARTKLDALFRKPSSKETGGGEG
jgi:hypothetical protein